MTISCFPQALAAYRNFNLCPHCASNGQPALLSRLCEGLPMISRSDGETFHLFLADRPLPYPLECASGPTHKLSVCFWYSHIRQPKSTFSTIVLLAGSRTNHPSVFRKIEMIADLLTERLACDGRLADVYELFERPDASLAAF
jgi:hypothetical protein